MSIKGQPEMTITGVTMKGHLQGRVNSSLGSQDQSPHPAQEFCSLPADSEAGGAQSGWGQS